MTLNLLNYVAPPDAAYQLDNIYSVSEWQKKCRWLDALITQAAPDLIALQEVFSADVLQEQLAHLGYSHFLSTVAEKGADDYVYTQPGLALASRFPLARHHPQSDMSPCSRLPLAAMVTLSESLYLKIYNVHLKSKRPLLDEDNLHPTALELLQGRWQSQVQRHQELACLMAETVSAHQKDGIPMLVVGDFNDDVSQGGYELLFSEVLSNACEKDPAPALLNWRLHDSWQLAQHKPELRKATHYYGAKGNLLDFILVSGEFSPDYQGQAGEVLQYQSWDRHLVSPDYSQDCQASDHAAIAVTLALRA